MNTINPHGGKVTIVYRTRIKKVTNYGLTRSNQIETKTTTMSAKYANLLLLSLKRDSEIISIDQ